MDKEATFDTGEVVIGYAEGPDNGPPFVLLHGVGGNREQNPRIHEPLRERTHLFRVELRGHGLSGHVTAGYRWTEYPKDIATLIRGVISEPAIVAGQSMGAVTTLALAGTEPELVRAQIASEPPFYIHDWENPGLEPFEVSRRLASLASTDDIEAGFREAYPKAGDAVVAMMTTTLSTNDPDTWGQVLDGSAFDGHEPDALLRAIRCPLMILYGDVELGGRLRPDDLDRIRRLAPAAELVHVPGVGHGVPREGASQFLEAVLPFLDRVAV